MKTKNIQLATVISAIAALSGCGSSDSSNDSKVSFLCDSYSTVEIPANDFENSFKQALAVAESCTSIELPAGEFDMTSTVSFDAQLGEQVYGISIIGKGKHDAEAKTVINFEGTQGDGIHIENARNIRFENFAVLEAGKNAIKVINSEQVIMRNLSTIWATPESEDNGAYGLYPVQSKHILVEDSYVEGSADAGIYVGQSENIVVRRNTAHRNVAGIEIENSIGADVYQNTATANTGGVLIFDLPIGSGRYGRHSRVFDNTITGNNTKNFAVVGSFEGGVHIVPPGTGVIVLATDEVEIYNNTISDHDTLSVAIADYQLAASSEEMAKYVQDGVVADGWTPTPRALNIHNNKISNTGNNPNGTLLEDTGFIELVAALQQTETPVFPAIMYDGLGELLAGMGVAANFGVQPFTDSDRICAKDNIDPTNNNQAVTEFQVFTTFEDGNAFGPEDGTPDPTPVNSIEDCTHEALSASYAEINGVKYGCGFDDTDCQD